MLKLFPIALIALQSRVAQSTSRDLPPEFLVNSTMYWQTSFDLSLMPPVTPFKCGELQGGGFLTNEHLYMLGCSEKNNAALFKMDITRHGSTNKVIGIDATTAIKLFEEGDMVTGFNFGPGDISTQGLGDYLWWTSYDQNNILSYGSFINDVVVVRGRITSAAIRVFTESNRYPSNDYDFFGFAFHPSFPNPNTPGHGYMYAGATRGIYRVELGPVANTAPTEYEIINIIKICYFREDYVGGMAAIPSGPNKDDLLITDIDTGSVYRLPLDSAGLASDDYELPSGEMLPIAYQTFYVTNAWAFIMDKSTNDFLVACDGGTSYGPPPAETPYKGLLHSFSGFPPGFNADTMVASISDRIDAFIANANVRIRRELRKQDGSSSNKNNKLNNVAGNVQNKRLLGKSGKTSKGSGGATVVVDVTPTQAEIEALLADPATASVTTVNLLNAVLGQPGALSGDDPTNVALVTAQIERIAAAVNAVLAGVIQCISDPTENAAAVAAADEIGTLLSSLEFAGTGLPSDFFETNFEPFAFTP